MVGENMSEDLINQLSKLKLEKTSLIRNLDLNYYNIRLRNKLFSKIKIVDKEIERVKFKIRMERLKKNANNNTVESEK